MIRKNEFNFELFFKIIYFVLVLLSFNTFFARTAFITYLSYFVAFYGGIVLLNRLTHIRDYISKPTLLLGGFLLSYGLSSILMREYGLVENVQAMVWMAIQFFIVFSRDKRQDKKFADKEFDVIMSVFFVYTFACAIIGLVMMALKYSYYNVYAGKYIIAGGFLWNRLWGCYIDPNYGAVFAIISIAISLYFFNTKNLNKLIKSLLVINIVAEYLYIAYSDSRTGRAAILVTVTIVSFLLLNKDISKLQIGKLLKSGVLSLVIASLVLGGVYTVQRVTSEIQVKLAYSRAIKQGASVEEAGIVADMERVGRKDEEINGGDYSNNRFAIWGSALELFAEKPVFGVTFRTLINYADEHQPNGFIAKSGFESMHNTVLDIAVSQGITGIIIALAFFVVILHAVIVYIKNNDLGHKMILAISIILTVSVSAMFYSDIFYMNTGGAFLTWMSGGYLVNELFDQKLL